MPSQHQPAGDIPGRFFCICTATSIVGYNESKKEADMEKQCTKCMLIFPEEELLVREDNAELVCEDCSGLQEQDYLSCRYDEQG